MVKSYFSKIGEKLVRLWVSGLEHINRREAISSISDRYKLGTSCIAVVLWQRKKYFDSC